MHPFFRAKQFLSRALKRFYVVAGVSGFNLGCICKPTRAFADFARGVSGFNLGCICKNFSSQSSPFVGVNGLNLSCISKKKDKQDE